MNSKPIQPNQFQADNDTAEITFDSVELEQLAKFLDALLEVDIANRSNEGNLK